MPAPGSESTAGRRPPVSLMPSAAERRRRRRDSPGEELGHETAGKEHDLVPPYDAAIEGAVLQSAILWPATREAVMAQLKPEDFYVPLHRQIFEACSDLLGAGAPIDYQLVARELERRDVMPASRAAIVLIGFEGVPFHGVALAREVARLARCRRLLAAATTAAGAARRGDEDGALVALREVM